MSFLLVPLLVVTVTACDTDDGRQMQEPTKPIPPPPPSTTPSAATDYDSMIDLVSTEPAVPTPDLALVAPWQNGAEIPALYSCDGDQVSPTLRWVLGPEGTAEYALTIVDPDAGNYVHWIVMGIDPSATSVEQGSLPPGVTQGPNSAGTETYLGPCPPPGATHNYLVTVYALGQQLELAGDESPGELLALFQATALASSTVSGTYKRVS